MRAAASLAFLLLLSGCAFSVIPPMVSFGQSGVCLWGYSETVDPETGMVERWECAGPYAHGGELSQQGRMLAETTGEAIRVVATPLLRAGAAAAGIPLPAAGATTAPAKPAEAPFEAFTGPEPGDFQNFLDREPHEP